MALFSIPMSEKLFKFLSLRHYARHKSYLNVFNDKCIMYIHYNKHQTLLRDKVKDSLWNISFLFLIAVVFISSCKDLAEQMKSNKISKTIKKYVPWRLGEKSMKDGP